MSRILLTTVVLVAGALAVSPARAALPLFNATCPGGLEVHADEGGPVFVDGREAQLQRFSDGYYEARDRTSGVTLSITQDANGVQLSYTGPGNANGVCRVAGATGVDNADSASAGGSGRSTTPAVVAEGDLLGACNVRAGAPGRLVTRMPVGEDAAELIVDYPDGRFVCMVRNDGFVTSLTRVRGR